MERRRITPFRVLLAIVFALVVIGVVTARQASPALAPQPGEPTATVWLVDNGFHTDLAVPAADILAAGGPAAQALGTLPPHSWVLVGWGDAQFYTETGFTGARVLDGLRALFAPNNPSVVHLLLFDGEPNRAFGGPMVPIRLSRAGEASMLARLNASMAQPIRQTARWGPNDAFFAGSEHFSVTHLCNHWTGEMLSAAGLANIPLINTVPGGLRLGLWLQGVKGQALDEAAARP